MIRLPSTGPWRIHTSLEYNPPAAPRLDNVPISVSPVVLEQVARRSRCALPTAQQHRGDRQLIPESSSSVPAGREPRRRLQSPLR